MIVHAISLIVDLIYGHHHRCNNLYPSNIYNTCEEIELIAEKPNINSGLIRNSGEQHVIHEYDINSVTDTIVDIVLVYHVIANLLFPLRPTTGDVVKNEQ